MLLLQQNGVWWGKDRHGRGDQVENNTVATVGGRSVASALALEQNLKQQLIIIAAVRICATFEYSRVA